MHNMYFTSSILNYKLIFFLSIHIQVVAFKPIVYPVEFREVCLCLMCPANGPEVYSYLYLMNVKFSYYVGWLSLAFGIYS